MVVMCHPRRAGIAGDLATTLGHGTELVFDPEPNASPNALRTAARAWAHCDTSSHHAVVQDDVLPTTNIWPLLRRATSEHPDSVLTFYANSTCWNGAVARAAVLAGRTWVTPVAGEYFPTLATVMPCSIAHEFASLAAVRAGQRETDDDEVLADFLAERRIPALLRAPNLVEHQGVPSLSGWDADPRRPDMFGGVRRSLCFQATTPEPGSETHIGPVPAWAMFHQRRALLRLPSRQGRARWQTQSRASHYKALRISRELICGIADARLALLAPLPERGAAARRFVRELCLAGYSLGWIVAAISPNTPVARTPVNDAALSSYIESGLGKESAVARWRGHWKVLLDIIWAAVHEGCGDAISRSPHQPNVPLRALTSYKAAAHVAPAQIR
jgi:hypothetical protein